MRIHKLLATVLAAGLVFSGCHQDEDYLLPDIEINAESLDFSDDTELKISLTASRDWLVRSKPDWVAVDPDHGSASSAPQRVVISVLPNNDYNRTGEVLFTIGLDKAAVEVIQPGAKGEKPRGSGTLEDPYTVGGVLDYVKSLGADVESPQDVYIKGKIASVTEAYSSQFGNGTFVIRGESADETFTVYRALYLGNKKWTDKDTQIKEGDDVIVCGKVIYFKGNTPETQQNKAYLYSLNGEVREAGSAGTPAGEGTLDKPYNVAGVLNYINTLGADVESPSEVYISGEIAEVTEAYSSNFGNGTFTIKDADADAVFTVYRALYLGNQKYADGNTQIKVGDKVVVCGKVINYKGNTPETQQNKAYLYSLNGTTAGGSSSGGEQGGSGSSTGTATGDGSQASPFNIAGANAAVAKLTWTSNEDYQKTDNVYVKGKISRIAVSNNIEQVFTSQYGNASFYISDDGSQNGEFYVFRTLYLGNNKWVEGNTQIKVGDDVIIYGQLMNYKGNTPETVANASYIYSLNGNTAGGSSSGGEQGGSQGGEQGGGQTTADVKTVTVAEFIKAEVSQTQKYQLTGKITGSINTQYGNFDLEDATGTVFVYGLTKTDLGYGAKNDQSYAGLGLKAGDIVTIIGYRGVHNDKIEVLNAYYVKHESGSDEQGGSQGGEQGGGQTTSEVKTISIGDFLKVPDSDTQKYQLTGKISNIRKDKNDSSKPNAYGNFDLTDETGTVYVYGLTKEELKTDSGKGYENGKAKNDQSFNSLNLKEGDTLTLIGYKYTYTNNETSKVEVMGAYHVSHQSAE